MRCNAFLLGVLALLAYICALPIAPQVSAQSGGQCTSFADGCDAGQAYSACMARAGSLAHDPFTAGRCVRTSGGESSGVYACRLDAGGGNFPYDCSEPNQFLYNRSCSSREQGIGNALAIIGAGAQVATCHNGCRYVPTTGTTSMKAGVSDVTLTTSTGWAPEGGVCTVEQIGRPSANDQECVKQGTLTQCLRKDGKNCAQASTGATFCWAANEAGVKTSPNGNEAATKSPDNVSINAPRDPPKNGGDWTVTGQSTTTINNNGETKNYNTTTYQSNYGNQGGGPGTGTGTGPGTGEGGGDGDGGGDDDGGNEPGGPGAGPGELYGGTNLTMAGMVSEYYGKVSNTPMLNSVRSFMMVQGGGSCPVFALGATQWTPSLTFDAHCSGTVYNALLAMGWVLFAIVAYFAIRISVT